MGFLSLRPLEGTLSLFFSLIYTSRFPGVTRKHTVHKHTQTHLAETPMTDQHYQTLGGPGEHIKLAQKT